MRPGMPGAYRLLEWGQATDTPRSNVRDREGRMLFTGSEVLHKLRRGKIVSMQSERAVTVAWDSGTAESDVDPSLLSLLHTPPRT